MVGGRGVLRKLMRTGKMPVPPFKSHELSGAGGFGGMTLEKDFYFGKICLIKGLGAGGLGK